jgi:methyl-accepting chemotaxis protein WspA
MKKMTIWQRLNTVLVVLILFLLVGVGLALWVEETRLRATERNEQLTTDKNRIYLDVLLVSDAVRALIVTPTDKTEKDRRKAAEDSMASSLGDIQKNFADYPELLDATRKVSDFCSSASGGLSTFYTRVIDMAEGGDPSGTVQHYNKNFPNLREKRDTLFADLTKQIDVVKGTETRRAQTREVIGITCIALILVACLIVGKFQSSAVTEPLNQLVAAMERMRRGDFTHRLASNRRDEFGVLSDGLDRLADDLSGLVGQVQRSGIQVNTTATQISATAKEQQSTAHEIAATTAQIGATSKQISATSKELVKTMNEVNLVAEEAAHLAGSGQTAIARMEATMRQILDATGSITGKLAVLSEKTTNINSVVTTITKVADQTNLLSLNAAIEAEKAGEYGLGFAVVAMEIRRLADQTAVATYDIEKMVKQMQSAVAAGVMGMDKFSDEARRGVEEIRQVSSHLAQIIHQVQTLTPRFQAVNEGMHAQATGAQQISETLTQLSEAAQQTAESLRQSNLAIEQLNGAARGLQTSVARFKLEI